MTQNLIFTGAPEVVGDGIDQDCDGQDGVSGECSSFEAEDCNGMCTVNWLGDGICDDGTYQYNGYGVDFPVKTLTMMMVIVQLVSIMMEMDLLKTRIVMIQTLQFFRALQK